MFEYLTKRHLITRIIWHQSRIIITRQRLKAAAWQDNAHARPRGVPALPPEKPKRISKMFLNQRNPRTNLELSRIWRRCSFCFWILKAQWIAACIGLVKAVIFSLLYGRLHWTRTSTERSRYAFSFVKAHLFVWFFLLYLLSVALMFTFMHMQMAFAVCNFFMKSIFQWFLKTLCICQSYLLENNPIH